MSEEGSEDDVRQALKADFDSDEASDEEAVPNSFSDGVDSEEDDGAEEESEDTQAKGNDSPHEDAIASTGSAKRQRKADGDGLAVRKKKKKPSDHQGSDSEPEIVQGLSGDEVDVSNIVQGGRRARRGRAQSAHEQIQKYKQKAQDSDEDSW